MVEASGVYGANSIQKRGDSLIGFIKKWLTAGLARYMGGEKDWGHLTRLFKLILEYKTLVLVALLAMVGFNLFNALPAWYAKDVVDSLQKGNIPDLNKFILIGLAVFLIFAVKGGFFFTHNYLLGKAAQRVIHRLRSELYRHLQTFSFSFFSHRSAGDLISRFTTDLMTLQTSLRIIVLGPMRDIPQIFLFLGILIYRSWQMFLFSIVLIPIAMFIINRFGKRTKRLTSQRLASFSEMTTILHETINGIRVVKAFNMEEYERGRFEKTNDDIFNRYIRTIRIMAYSVPVLEIIGSFSAAGIIIFGGHLIIIGAITPGDFVSYLFALFMLNNPIKKLNNFQLQLQEGLSAAERIYEIMDLEPEEVDAPEARELPPISRELRIQVDQFRYADQQEPVLSGIDLKIKAGQVVALVGASGAGKTTLVNLIPRFFNLQQGCIRIDGTDIREATLASLRNQIAIVTQEIFLFNDTVANNIAYGNIECPREQIIAAAKGAHAHAFVMELPQKYETLVGEGGLLLSGGQRQRISIARALIKNAPILILDEATSALDSEAEQEVQKAIETLILNRTTIVIAHRLSTIQRADLICVMDEGRIVEQGRHDDLMRLGGVYKKLYDLQFRDVPEIRQGGRKWRGLWQRLTDGDHKGTAKTG